jgi:hypothetical protein
MSDEPEKKDDPAEELKQGLTHLWRAARSVGREVKKEVDRTEIGKVIDDAGREIVRAATNVMDRLSTEVNELTKPPKAAAGPEVTPPTEVKPDDDEFDGVKPREKADGSTAQDPGIRIAVEDDTKKKPE